jgi:chromosomal replication initiator protein
VVGQLKDEVGDTAYRSWLQSLRVERMAEGEAVVAAPTRFLRNWVATHYADRLLALWRIENPAVFRLSLIVDPRIAPPPREGGSGATAAGSDPTTDAGPTGESGLASPAENRPAEAWDDRGHRTPPPAALPRPAPAPFIPFRSTRFSSMAGSVSARPI